MKPKQVVENLRKNGIDTVDALAEKLMNSMSGEDILTLINQPESEKVDYERLQALFSKETKPPSTHIPPMLSFKLNGKFYRPDQVSEFKGKSLHFFSERNAISEGYMLAYSTRAELRTALEQRGLLSPNSSNGTLKSWFWEDKHRFYEHAGFWGQKLELNPDGRIDDLTRRQMFPRGSWNDRISSIRTSRSRGVLLCEHVRGGGSIWAIDANSAYATLAWWNDRISSIYSLLGTQEV